MNERVLRSGHHSRTLSTISYFSSLISSHKSGGEGGVLFEVPRINILEIKLAVGTRVKTIKAEIKLFTA